MEGVQERPPRPPPAAVQVQRERHSNPLLKVDQLSDEAKLYIEQGLSCDEHGQGEQAKSLYEKGLRCIMEALSIPIDSSNPQYSIIKSKQERMRRTQQQMQDRLNHLIQNDPNVARSIDDPPPTYEDATTPEQSDFDLALSMSDSIMNDDASASSSRRGSLVANASELLKIDEGVQIFFITPEGYVSAPSYPSDLNIYKFIDPPQTASNIETPAFLKVGDWTYPLVPGCSPALQANWGAYVFPDTTREPGSCVGVIIPDTISVQERTKFEHMLKDLTALRTQASSSSTVPLRPAPPRAATSTHAVPQTVPRTSSMVAPPSVEHREPTPKPCGPQEQQAEERTSTKVAKGLVTAAEWITWGLEKGAEQTGKLLKKGSTSLQANIRPDEKHAKIDPRAQKGIHYARVGTGAAVKVSRYVVEKLGQATMHLAREAAPHVRKYGEKLLPESMTSKREGRSKLDNVAEVTAGGLQGFATVYNGLENAAKHLGKSLANETVHVVKHKYGSDAGQLTENTLYAAGNLGVTVYNANHLGVKAIAKRAAKDTGLAVIEDASGEQLAPAKNKQPRTEPLQRSEATDPASSDGQEKQDNTMEVDTQSNCATFSNEKSGLP